jgi:protein-S-isoprenylcysteine O-methyltransferase Ste14
MIKIYINFVILIIVMLILCGILIPNLISADNDFAVWAGVCMWIGIIPICYFLGNNIFKNVRSINHKNRRQK